MDYSYVVVALTGLVVIGYAGFYFDSGEVYGVDYVVNNSGKLEGSTITVKGEVLRGPKVCTQMFCMEDNPCCNSCSASVKLKQEKEIKLTGKDPGCSGTNCALNCTPATGKKYLVTGKIKVKSGNTLLKVETFKEAAK
ncbi:MAG: hypothetical protein ABEK04_02910 [Candidatus Nanohalobium sp.]